MLLRSFFVIDFRNHDDLPDIKLPENGFISFKLNAGAVREFSSFYKKLFLKPKKYSFCLLIDLNELLRSGDDLNTVTDFMISCSFHLQYIKTSRDNPLILFEIDNDDSAKYISTIRETFRNQGYDDINAMLIFSNRTTLPERERKSIQLDLWEDMQRFLLEYIDSIKKLNSSDSYFLLFLSDPQKINDVLMMVQEAEARVAEDFPKLYHLLRENSSLETKKQKLLTKIGLLEEQLDSVGNYHLYYDASDTRYKRQISELLRFYNNEYEILPTWYKRFGHMIKVLMGKRTFRSLFDDNVKKYKD